MTQENKINIYLPVFVLVITQLHLLRNATSLYLLVYLFALILAVWYLMKRLRLLSAPEKTAILYFAILIFIPLCSMQIGIIRGDYHDFGEVAIGLSRTLFVLPIYLVILASPSSNENISILLKTVSVITLVAALSIPFQFIFGPISWLADSSMRSGFARYASMFGSLTALGLVCGSGVLTTLISIRSSLASALLVAGIVLGSLLSFQKAAIVNLVLCFAIVPFIRKFKFRHLMQFVVLSVIIFCLAGVFFDQELSGFLDSFKLFSDSDVATYSDDVSISESLVERLILNPSVAINYHGIGSLILGLGPIGGSGAFGYPDIPMSHNGIVDLFLVGGIFYFLMFFRFVFFVISMSRKRLATFTDKPLVLFGIFCFFLLLLNMPFSGLIFFTPSNAMFFAISLKCILLKK